MKYYILGIGFGLLLLNITYCNIMIWERMGRYAG